MQGKKKLIQPHIEPKLSGLNQSGVNPVYGKKNYQFFCPRCTYGPIISALTKIKCLNCGKNLSIVSMPGGDYKVELS